jgi:sugar transferase EpsL
LKRLLDVLIVLFSAPLWVPVVAVLALFVWIFNGRPVLFRQVRAGQGGKPFELVKFRSMRGEDNQASDTDAERITPFGAFLRNSSLDELPELWNVLKGDMSLVGPRPLPLRYLPRYSERQARRHGVKPGITGWAQINGRNALSWEKKFELDVWYVDHQSTLLDLRVLWMTAGAVLLRKGVSQEGHATMEEFLGSGDV